jgi:anaerobic ribonucleoside-triphosphate reductase/ribosomal protein S25
VKCDFTKYESFIYCEDKLFKVNEEQLSKFLSALDNPVKLRIIDSIYREGSLSLTDVRNKLKISFSTAFKYLNQLESAGVLNCKRTVVNGRQKNLYFLSAFDFRFSPETISGLFREKEVSIMKKPVMMLDWEGKLQKFDIGLIEKILYDVGVSEQIASDIISKINDSLYDGMSFEELRGIIFSVIEEKVSTINRMKEILQSSEILSQKMNFLNILENKGFSEIAKAHINRDIHIRNIGKTYPISVQHNFNFILKHGLKAIGIDTKPASNIISAISHFETVIKAVNENLGDFQQSFDCLNVFLAPLIRDMSKSQIKQAVERIIYSQDQAYTISSTKTWRTTINLEPTVPEFLKKQPAYTRGKEIGVLGDFESEAEQLLRMFFDVLKEKGETINPKIIVKIRDRKKIPEGINQVLNQVYIANLTPEWQTENANYSFDWSRLDASWKGWKRTLGIPCMQMVSLNLPRLGYITKDEDKLLELVAGRVELAKKCLLVSIENILGKTYTELHFLSRRVEEEKYCHFDDASSFLALVGMKELIEIMAGDYVENKKLALKIISSINKQLKRDENLRVEVVELDYSPVSQSFVRADALKFKGNKKNYSGGVDLQMKDDEKIGFLGDFHKVLKGGHMCQLKSLNMELLNKVLKSDIGLAAGKALDKL